MMAPTTNKKKKKKKNWKEVIGPIPNVLSLLHTTSSSSTKPTLPIFLKELQQKIHPPPSSSRTKDYNEESLLLSSPLPKQYSSLLIHGRDYILVGSNVWLLLSSKFGIEDGTTSTAAELKCHYRRPYHHHNHDTDDDNLPLLSLQSSSNIFVAVTTIPTTTHLHFDTDTDTDIPLPMTGRFPYEQYFQPSPPPTTTNTEYDDSIGLHDPSDDLKNQKNDKPTISSLSSSSSPIILLPPSTTTTTTTTTTTIMPRNPQDMEEGKDYNNNDENELEPIGSLNHIDYNHTNTNRNHRFHNNNKVKKDDDEEEEEEDLFRDPTTTTTTTTSITTLSQQQQQYPLSTTTATTIPHVTVPVRRKYGSGLGNLGNTCFMNSTLQCLGHTLVLQYYFLSQQYQHDLNRYNPLGTGGELATQFALLLSEMWTTTTNIRTTTDTNHHHHQIQNETAVRYTTASYVVYPKNFKYTLGKHAAQFMGYDQHDSQELATYLLDALHEDCNRITTKPYIEKPEQTMEETDQQASDKAWELHLQREDSHILEYFMGQVKSRVQCNQIECQRISTTFDPFMFLSVPIPGSEDRTIHLTFVPIDTQLRNVKLSIKINKMSTMDDMLRKVLDLLPEMYEKDQYESSSLCTQPPLSVHDLAICDVWKREVFDYFQNKDDIEKIRDNDDTFIYQLSSLQMIRQQEAQLNDDTFIMSSDDNNNNNNKTTTTTKNDTDVITTKYNFKEWKRNNHITTNNGSSDSNSSTVSSKYRLYNLDVGTLTQLNRDQEWLRICQEKYMKAPSKLRNAFQIMTGNTEEKVRIYRRLAMFLDQLHQSIIVDTSDEHRRYEYGVPKRVRGSLDYTASSSSVNNNNNNDNNNINTNSHDPTQKVQELIDCSESNVMFQNVQTMEDLAILEFISKKMYLDILHSERTMKTKQLQAFPNGIIIEVRIRTNTEYHSYTSTIPLVIRISSNTTVYQLREIIAQRLIRCVKHGTTAKKSLGNIASTTSSDDYWSTAPENSNFAVTQAWDDVPTSIAVVENGDHGRVDMDLGDTDPMMSSADPLYEVAMNIVCRIPLFYDRKNSTAIHNRSNASNRPFGSVSTGQAQQRPQYQYTTPTKPDYHRPVITFAQRTHNEEKELISEIVGHHGHVYVNIPSSYIQEESFDFDAMHAMDVYQPSSSSASSRNNMGDITVLDCIEKFCQKEQLEESEQWYCNRCQQHVCAWKQFYIYRCPPHLIVHLKRFQFSARTHRRQKINIHVDFPLTGLDLSKQVLHWNNDNEKPIYDCYAVSNHYGGLGGGHYTAYAVNDDGVWCHYDDSRITSHISPSEVVSSAAYVLYYRRRDVPVDMEYIQKIVSSPQAIITEQQPYMSPYTVIGRDDIDDDIDNRPLLSNRSEPRVISSDTAVVPLFEEEEDDENTNLEDHETSSNNNRGAFTATNRADDDTGSHSSDDGLPLPSGLRVLSASNTITSAMIVGAEDDDDNNVASVTLCRNSSSDESGTDFLDAMTTTDPVVQYDDDDDADLEGIVGENVDNDDDDDIDCPIKATTATTTDGTGIRK